MHKIVSYTKAFVLLTKSAHTTASFLRGVLVLRLRVPHPRQLFFFFVLFWMYSLVVWFASVCYHPSLVLAATLQSGGVV